MAWYTVTALALGLFLGAQPSSAFRASAAAQSLIVRRAVSLRSVFTLSDGDGPSKEDEAALADMSSALTVSEKQEVVGNLVADDEYLGLTMELTELVRLSIKEELKGRVREFTGSDDYKIGDISKTLDARIKDEVAQLRGKEEYELGDLSIALDTMAKEEVQRLTGKEVRHCPPPRAGVGHCSQQLAPLHAGLSA